MPKSVIGETWRVDGQFDAEVGITILTNTDETVIEAYPFLDEWTDTEIARVRLMAAAPELLEACRTVLDYLNALESATAPDDPLAAVRRLCHAPLRAKLEPAIAKTEGLNA